MHNVFVLHLKICFMEWDTSSFNLLLNFFFIYGVGSDTDVISLVEDLDDRDIWF